LAAVPRDLARFPEGLLAAFGLVARFYLDRLRVCGVGGVDQCEGLVHVVMPELETLAVEMSCAECRRKPERGDVWRLLFADIGEVAVYCPECAEREFDDSRGR
jgi:hypothetical protein